ncbi:DCC-interacting protein 13-alpha-like [Ruditapes philippinarum]|uniref:DCC-interacting protein 13-alpha-like n=1 Tax=Ruditapes philippinarum TaxID=129788 RepID=UPI00295A990F|nr:DCC-interacting protein 13-alpha-like [Ruditapes philippinarum]
MPEMPKLHLEDALEDSPQTRNLLSVFEKDAMVLKKYSVGLHNCCQRVMSAQNELCAATQSLSQHLRNYELQKFPLETENSILTSTLEQFAAYLDNISSLQQVLSAQFSETMMYPMTKAIQADLDEISTMYEMFQIATHEHEHAMIKFMKIPKKKDCQDANEELYMMRKKYHQTSLHYYSALNALQYKRKCFLLEPIIGYLHSQRAYFSMGQETVCKPEMEDFLQNISTSIQGVQSELQVETKKTVDLIDSLEQQSLHMYHAEPPINMPYIPPNINLAQKSGYLFLRSKQLIGNKWDRCFFFTQGGNLMSQSRDEVAGSLVLDLNDEGVFAEPTDADDRRNVFQISTAKHRRMVVLQAENERERDEWISTLNNVVRDSGFVRGGKVPTTSTNLRKPVGKAAQSFPGKFGKIFYVLNIRYCFTIQVRGESTSSQKSSASNTSPEQESCGKAMSETQSAAPTPSTGPNSPYLPDTPIQFDLCSPEDQNGATVNKSGPPKRINPFDQSATDVIDALDEAIDNAAFIESFLVRFLGSMEVKQDRGEKLVHETIRQIMAARAIHNVFKMTESRMVVSSECMRLIEPSNNTVRVQFALEDISYWAAHHENNRLFGFITRNKGEGSYACHVFECNVSAGEICNAIGTATKMAFHALMEKKATEKIRSLKDKEKDEGKDENLLLANINQLEDKEEEEESLLSSNLPLSSDKNYMKLSAEDEQDMMDEMDREMSTLDLKPDSPRTPAAENGGKSEQKKEEDLESNA